MTDTFGHMSAGRGESCSNIHPQNGYTCPGCYTDFEFSGVEEGADKFVHCPSPECKAPLRLEIEMVPNYRAVVVDPDEEEDETFEEVVV